VHGSTSSEGPRACQFPAVQNQSAFYLHGRPLFFGRAVRISSVLAPARFSRGSPQLGMGTLGHDHPHSLDRPGAVPAGTKFQILSSHVDGSVPFGESKRFACTGAPVLRALGPASFQPCRIDKCFTGTGGVFFGAVLSALAPGWPGSVFEGLSLRGPML